METAVLVEPRKERKKFLADFLHKEGLKVESFTTAEQALEQTKKFSTDIVIVDVSMPTQSGLDTLEQLKSLDMKVFVLTASETTAMKHDLYALGDVVPPVPEKALLGRLRGILSRRRTSKAHPLPRPVTPVNAHVLADLHDPETGRLDASRIASYLETPLSSFRKFCHISVAGLHKSPASASMQTHLAPIARSLAILTQLLTTKEHVLAWMNSPHPDLGSETPIHLILEGKAQVVADLLQSALAGQLS
jgi:DNA-binding response OmpR family regulator